MVSQQPAPGMNAIGHSNCNTLSRVESVEVKTSGQKILSTAGAAVVSHRLVWRGRKSWWNSLPLYCLVIFSTHCHWLCPRLWKCLFVFLRRLSGITQQWDDRTIRTGWLDRHQLSARPTTLRPAQLQWGGFSLLHHHISEFTCLVNFCKECLWP